MRSLARSLARLLLLALAATAPSEAALRTDGEDQLHESFVSQVTLQVRHTKTPGWLQEQPTWVLTDTEMNPIVTSSWARNYYEALATAEVDRASPWSLVLHAQGDAEAVPVAPHRAFEDSQGERRARLEFLIRMGPAVRALELRHGDAVVHRWDRPATPPPEAALRTRCAAGASGPLTCAVTWREPPPGTWIQLMSRAGGAGGGWGHWRDHRLAPGRSQDSVKTRHPSLQLELSFTDGFRCRTQRLSIRGR